MVNGVSGDSRGFIGNSLACLDSTLPLMIGGAVTYYANWLGINKKYSGALGAGAVAITVPVQRIILKESVLFPILATVVIAPAVIDVGKKAVNFVSNFFSNEKSKQITSTEQQPLVNEGDNNTINEEKVETIEEEDESEMVEESSAKKQDQYNFIETTKTTHQQRLDMIDMIEEENTLLFSKMSFENCITIAKAIIDKYFQKDSEKLKEDFARLFKLELPEIPERTTLDLQFEKHPHETHYIYYLLEENMHYWSNYEVLKDMNLHITEENKNVKILKAMEQIYAEKQQQNDEAIDRIVTKFTKEEIWLLMQNMIVNYVNNGIEIHEMNDDTKGRLDEIQQFLLDAITKKLGQIVDDGNAVIEVVGKIMTTFPEILLFKGSGKISEISSIRKSIGFSIQKTNNIFELVKLLNSSSVIYYVEMNVDYDDCEEESDYSDSDIESSDEDEGENDL